MSTDPTKKPPCPTGKRRGRYRLLLAAAVGLGLLCLLVSHQLTTPRRPADPRHSFPTRWRNVRPEVQFVGDAACAACHPGQAATYGQHPMGRSLGPITKVRAVERYDALAHNPFVKYGLEFSVDRHEAGVLHRQIGRDATGRALTRLEAEVQYAVGSGTKGRTYLICRNEHVFQSPISWFSQEGRWDGTPGFEARDHFERPAKPDCLWCHANQVEPVPHSVNRYRPPLFRGHAIGCERCHGPGELHVSQREAGVASDFDDTIVHPARLEPALRDAVCEQCHLHGEARITRRGRELAEFRPGLPLHLFVSVFVRKPEFAADDVGSHTEQTYSSRCYQGSQGRLGCISCHDPHVKPDEASKDAYFRARCVQCHPEPSCRLPLAERRLQQPADSCIACHMPRAASKIAHTARTDHRIPRRPENRVRPTGSPRPLRPGETPLVHFHDSLVPAGDAEAARDLGLALVELGQRYPGLIGRLGPLALPLLERAIQTDAGDVAVREAAGFLCWQLGHKEEGLKHLQAALREAPEREMALTYAAALAGQLGDLEQAAAYWRRAQQINPWTSLYRFQRARVLAEGRQWSAALDECREALRLSPASREARMLLVRVLRQSGNESAARGEWETLSALNPAEADIWQRWYDDQGR